MTNDHAAEDDAPETSTHEPADEAVAHHDSVTHMDAHTTLSDDDHGHAESTLGPIDWGAWSYAIVGGIAALVVLAFFFIAIGGSLG